MNHTRLVRTEARQCALCRCHVPVIVVLESARRQPGASLLRARRVSEVATVVDVAVAAAGNPVRSACRRRGSATHRFTPHAESRLVHCAVHRNPLVQSVAAAVDPITVEGANIVSFYTGCFRIFFLIVEFISD